MLRKETRWVVTGTLGFQRRRVTSGEGSRHHREWLSACGRFLITWRNRVEGVALHAPAFGAQIRCSNNGRQFWRYVYPWPWGRSRCRTLAAAIRLCELYASETTPPDLTAETPRRGEKQAGPAAARRTMARPAASPASRRLGG